MKWNTVTIRESSPAQFVRATVALDLFRLCIASLVCYVGYILLPFFLSYSIHKFFHPIPVVFLLVLLQ